jgi:hypothetical protein
MDGQANANGARSRGVVVLLIKDVFFSVAVRNNARALGFDVHLTKSCGAFADSLSVVDPVLGIVDLHAVGDDGDWDCVREVIERDVPVLVFGPHRDVDGMRAAKAAGVTRVVSNGQFHAEMGTLITRYARRCADAQPFAADGAEDELVLSSVPPGMAEPAAQALTGEFGTRG